MTDNSASCMEFSLKCFGYMALKPRTVFTHVYHLLPRCGSSWLIWPLQWLLAYFLSLSTELQSHENWV